MNKELKDELGGYQFELGGEEQVQGDQATYLANVKTERNDMQQFRFELQRDEQSRLWHISMMDANGKVIGDEQ